MTTQNKNGQATSLISAVFAIIDLNTFSEALTELKSLCGISTIFEKPESGRVIFILSGLAEHEQKALIKKIKDNSSVYDAALVFTFKGDSEWIDPEQLLIPNPVLSVEDEELAFPVVMENDIIIRH